MQVATLLRLTLALDAHRVASVTRPSGTVVVKLELVARRLLPCSSCGRLGRVRGRLPERRWRHLPVWKIPVELVYRPARVACTNCATPKVEVIPWSMGKSTLSRPMIVELARWSRLLAWDVWAARAGRRRSSRWPQHPNGRHAGIHGIHPRRRHGPTERTFR